MSSRIVVVGSSNTDMIIQVEHIPKPGETIIGGVFSIAAGGKGANQAVGAARAGGNVTLVARVGDDMFGKQAINGFVKDNIDVGHVKKDSDAPSGVALIFVDEEGENSIAVASGANANVSPADVQAARDSIASADILLMQLETPLETIQAAASIASESGVRVILNPAPAQPLSDGILRQVSVLTPNESEAELLTGITVENETDAETAANALFDKGVKTVLITLGSKGAFVFDSDCRDLVPGFEVEAVDSTAAGDVFNGALAVALAEGKPLKDAVAFANAAGALSVTRLGAQPSAPSRSEIDELLRVRS
ncbi:ribokinase [Acidobacteria bacterium AH-259-A15]|nr:ribokinase [Acidobacteria bacterium AH-259-A15]